MDPERNTQGYDIAVVMPVYNEETCIADVVEAWHDTLEALDIRFLIIVVNDGSKDRTADVLDTFARRTSIRVIHQANAGHGAAILRGYREAVRVADWVFQCDSDNEMPPDAFASLWTVREAYAAVFGYRQGRQQNLARKAISACSRMTVRLLFGSGVRDVNTPYRLIRQPVLRAILDQIPAGTFAPNVIMSGALVRARLPVGNLPVPHNPRQTGTVSIMKWRLWKAAFSSFVQTLRCRWTLDIKSLKEIEAAWRQGTGCIMRSPETSVANDRGTFPQ